MNPNPAGRPAEVLLVDDSADDIQLIPQAFGRVGIEINLHTVGNGAEGLAFLRKEGVHLQAPTPGLILLDLAMPVMDGQQTMAEMVSDPRLRGTPVVVMTTSDSAEDIKRMYELRCSTYIVKPLDFDDLESAIRQICRYWFALAALPGTNR